MEKSSITADIEGREGSLTVRLMSERAIINFVEQQRRDNPIGPDPAMRMLAVPYATPEVHHGNPNGGYQ